MVLGQEKDNRKTEREIKIEDQFVKAKLLEISGKTDNAIQLLDTIRRANPENGTVYFELAKLYFDKNDWNNTESSIRNAIKLQPDNTTFSMFEVGYLLSQNRSSEAISSLNQLISRHPNNVHFYRQLLDIQKKNNQYKDALTTIQLMEANMGKATDITMQKVEILILDNNPDEAILTLKSLSEKSPGNTSYLKRIVEILRSEQRIGEAEPYFKKILDIDPNDADAKLGLILISNQTISESDKVVTLLPLVKNPDIPIDAKISAALPFLEQQAMTQDSILNKQLIDVGDQLTLIHPNEAKAHAFYADVLKNSGNIIAASRQYERTLDLNKNIYAVWEQLMFCLNHTADFDKLDKVANDAIDYYPNQPLSYCFAAKAAQEKGNYKKAASLLEDALLISAGNPDIESRVWLIRAEAEFKQKNLNKAAEHIQKALTVSQQQNGDAWELNGDIALANNQPKDAAAHWQKALQTGGNDARIQAKLKTLKNP